MADKSFFYEKGMSNTPQKEHSIYSNAELNRIKVFRHIEETQPTSIYRVSKELKLAYTTVSYIVRDLVFAGVVSEKIKIGENNVAFKELTVPMEAEK